MNIKNTLFAAMLATVALSASAQEAKKVCSKDCQVTAGMLCKNVKDSVYHKVIPHAYVQAQFGAQYTLGEIDFGDLISPSAQLSVGYEFGSVVGARFAVSAWQSKGGSSLYDYLNYYPMEKIDYRWKYNYVAPTIAATFNMSNLISGVNPNRLVDIYAILGAGLNIHWGNKEHNALTDQGTFVTFNDNTFEESYDWKGTKAAGVAYAGLAADFKVSRKWTVTAEVNANLTGDRYNSKKAGNVDWYFNALAGVKYNIGKTYCSKKLEAPQPKVVYKDRIVEKVVEKIVEKPVEKVVEATRPPLHIEIFFNIAGFKLLGSEAQKVKEISNYMKKYPDAKLEVVGLCDKGTGTDKINNPLSEKRANLVKNILVKTYKIPADRINCIGKGSTIQPYEVPELNRVAVCDAK